MATTIKQGPDAEWRAALATQFRDCPKGSKLYPRCGEAQGECQGHCARMKALGLLDDGSPMKRKTLPLCGAKTRAGGSCVMRVVAGKRRCRLHGGLSTGPKTPEGRARCREASLRRWGKLPGSL